MTEIAVIFFLTLITGFLALSELAIVSSKPARLAAMVDRNVSGAKTALKLAHNPGLLLSTVQAGITLISILSGAYSGATLGETFKKDFSHYHMDEHTAEWLAIFCAVSLTTYINVILGELVPKQAALKNSETLACITAPIMNFLSKLFFPLVFFLDGSSKLILSLIFPTQISAEKVTEQEIKALIMEGAREGVIEQEENRVITNVMTIGDRSIKDVMTPKHKVHFIDVSKPIRQALERVATSPHSRFIAIDQNLYNILGVIWAKDMINAAWEEPKDLRHLIRSTHPISANIDVLDLVQIMRDSSNHIIVIYDDANAFIGIATAADLIKCVVA